MSEVARVDVEKLASACAEREIGPRQEVLDTSWTDEVSDFRDLILSCAVEPEKPSVPSTTHDWLPSKDGWTCAACGAKPSEQRAVAECEGLGWGKRKPAGSGPEEPTVSTAAAPSTPAPSASDEEVARSVLLAFMPMMPAEDYEEFDAETRRDAAAVVARVRAEEREANARKCEALHWSLHNDAERLRVLGERDKAKEKDRASTGAWQAAAAVRDGTVPAPDHLREALHICLGWFERAAKDDASGQSASMHNYITRALGGLPPIPHEETDAALRSRGAAKEGASNG